MARPLYFIIFVVLFCHVAWASLKPESKQISCHEYTKGLTFNDSQAIGTWHLLHSNTEKSSGSEKPHCVEFSPVSEKERKDLSDRIGQYVENLKWESLTLKMQIPCSIIKSNRTSDYYLERLEGDGSYRTLQMPAATDKMDLSEFHRYPMRLKVVEGQYLGMMDCHEKFVLLLGKQPNGSLDDRLKKMTDDQ